MKRLRSLFVVATLSCCVLVSPLGTLPAHAAGDACSEKGKILTLKPWYHGLTEGGDCRIKNIGSTPEEQASFIWKIVLNVVDDLFQLVGYIATGFIMYGAFLMMVSNGSPDKAARARYTMIYAIIGLAVALSSIAIVNTIAARIV